VFFFEPSAVFAWIVGTGSAVLVLSFVVAVPRLLEHSRRLDALADRRGWRRVGGFVSDDDILDGSGPAWHSAAEAFEISDGLLEHFAAHPSARAARRDLEHTRDRLRLAVENDIRFCLLLRDLHATNAREWGLRKGRP
jgi:hypothetical protein